MKKIVSIVLALLLVAGLAFCSFNKSKTPSPVEENTQETTEQEKEEKQEEIVEEAKQEEVIEKVEEEPKKEIDDDILKTYKYWVVFFNEDGSEIQREAIKWGTVPTYWSDIPYYEDGVHWYRFIGWTDRWGRDVKEFKPITGNTRFYAKYEIGGDVQHGGGGSSTEDSYHEQISSLTSVPGAYIKSKVTASNNMEFVFDAKMAKVEWCRVFGYWNTGNSGLAFQSATGAYGGDLMFYANDGTNTYLYAQSDVDIKQKNSYDVKYNGTTADASYIKVNGTTVKTFTTGTVSADKEIAIFDLTSNETGSLNNNKKPTTIYYMKIYKDGTLVRDYIPVKITKEVDKAKNAADSTANIPVGTLCFYDKVEKMYYPSSGPKTFSDNPDHLEVECLTTPGAPNHYGPYINTKVKPTDNMKFIYKAKMKSGQGSTPFGYYISYNPANGLAAHPYYDTPNSKTRYEIYFGSAIKYVDSPTVELDKESVFEFQLKANDNYLKADGNIIYDDTNEYSTISASNQDIYIMAERDNTSLTKSASFSIYYFKMIVNDVLVRDYIPVYTTSIIDKSKNATNSDDDIPMQTYCMYDKVYDKYYTNGGTGLFTADPIN